MFCRRRPGLRLFAIPTNRARSKTIDDPHNSRVCTVHRFVCDMKGQTQHLTEALGAHGGIEVRPPSPRCPGSEAERLVFAGHLLLWCPSPKVTSRERGAAPNPSAGGGRSILFPGPPPPRSWARCHPGPPSLPMGGGVLHPPFPPTPPPLPPNWSSRHPPSFPPNGQNRYPGATPHPLPGPPVAPGPWPLPGPLVTADKRTRQADAADIAA